MLEILFLVWFGKKLADVCRQRGRSQGWVALGVCFWLGGEFMGAIVGTLLGLGMGAYLVAVVVAIVGAFVSWTIVTSLPIRGGGAYP
jgi:outer membrane lipoprotein SlyB